MILPERVLGRPGAQWMTSGVAMGPMALRTCGRVGWGEAAGMRACKGELRACLAAAEA